MSISVRWSDWRARQMYYGNVAFVPRRCKHAWREQPGSCWLCQTCLLPNGCGESAKRGMWKNVRLREKNPLQISSTEWEGFMWGVIFSKETERFGTILTPKNCCYLFVEISARIKRRENSSQWAQNNGMDVFGVGQQKWSFENWKNWLFRVYRGFYCPVIWGT